MNNPLILAYGYKMNIIDLEQFCFEVNNDAISLNKIANTEIKNYFLSYTPFFKH